MENGRQLCKGLAIVPPLDVLHLPGPALPLAVIKDLGWRFSDYFTSARTEEDFAKFQSMGGVEGFRWTTKLLKSVTASDVHTPTPLSSPKPRSLYVYRPVVNADEIIAWAKDQGFLTTLTSVNLHVTLAYSRTEFDWSLLAPDTNAIRVSAVLEKRAERSVEQFKDATVLRFDSKELSERWQAIRDAGASWDFDGFKPHVTISYQGPEAIDHILPYQGEIILGPEVWAEISEDWSDGIVEKFQRSGEVFKVDAAHGVVFGFAIVCKSGGEDYFDRQGDHIPEDSMLKATVEFMESARPAKDMHGQTGPNVQKGTVVFGFPLTTDICKALGISSQKTGFLIGMKPNDPAMLAKFASGEYTGFSIGGSRIKDVAHEA